MKCNRILWSRNFFWFAQSYDIHDKTPKGLAIPPEYCGLTVSHRTMYGAFCYLPKKFLGWVSSQPQLPQFNVIRAFETEYIIAISALKSRDKVSTVRSTQ